MHISISKTLVNMHAQLTALIEVADLECDWSLAAALCHARDLLTSRMQEMHVCLQKT